MRLEVVHMNGWYIALIVIGCLIVAGLIGFLIYFCLGKGIYFVSQGKKIIDRSQSINDVLYRDCSTSLERVKKMADKDAPGYKEKYNDLINFYVSLDKQNKEEVTQAVTAVTNLLNAKEKRGLKRNILAAKKVLDSFEEEINGFKKQIAQTLVIDDKYHAMIKEPKERFRKFKEFCNQNEIELRPIKSDLDNLFDVFEEYFRQYEVDIDKADYTSAKEHLDKINKALEVLDKYGLTLPNSITMAQKVIPERLKVLKQEEVETENLGVPLTHLGIDIFIDRANQRLVKINQDLKLLKIARVKTSLDEILNGIDTLERKIDTEKLSKDEFNKIQNDKAQSILLIQEKYASIQKKIKTYKKIYVLDDDFFKKSQELGEMIELDERLRRENDESLTNHDGTPYSSLLESQKKISELNKNIADKFSEFKEFEVNVKNVLDGILDELNLSYLNICKARRAIMEFDVHSYIEAKAKEVSALMNEINDVYNMTTKTPIDVEKCKKEFEKLKNNRDLFLGKIKRDKISMINAEILITYAAQYRRNYQDIENETKNAELEFKNARFDNAASIMTLAFNHNNIQAPKAVGLTD